MKEPYSFQHTPPFFILLLNSNFNDDAPGDKSRKETEILKLNLSKEKRWRAK